MNKMIIASVSAIALSLGMVAVGGAAQASSSEMEASGVSAYYRVDLGYKVGWQPPPSASRSTVASYTVTANPSGKVCNASGHGARECTFRARDLGYSGSFNFTVTTNLRNGQSVVSSDVSNTVGAQSVPSGPLLVSSKVVSDTHVNVAWVPSSDTGNAAIYGYKITRWESDRSGAPINNTRTDVMVTGTSIALERLDPSTMYVINVATCNALGCTSADLWEYATTTPTTKETDSITLPRVIGGGRADTTCFESISDAMAGTESTDKKCGGVVADPSTYPVVDPSATTLDINLETKFAQRAVLTLPFRYSLATSQRIGGISWFSGLYASSKSFNLGFTATPVIWSTTPSVCEVVGDRIILHSRGNCTMNSYVEGNGIWLQSNTAIRRLTVN